MKKDSEPVDFGFEQVSPADKTKKVTDVFKRVASKYDVMNDLMSGGLHRLWKKWYIDALPLKGQATYLDVAGGTGDIAKGIWERLHKRGLASEITICDINPHMLAEGKKRRASLPLTWTCGNAENLPVPDNSVDVYTIAFGLRNVTRVEKALAEAHRVLKPGGTFACLEFSTVSPLLKGPYDLYSFNILPKMGEIVANDRKAYEYLVESIRKFPNQRTLQNMMRGAGFPSPTYENYMGGIACVHRGIKK